MAQVSFEVRQQIRHHAKALSEIAEFFTSLGMSVSLNDTHLGEVIDDLNDAEYALSKFQHEISQPDKSDSQ